MAGCASRYNCLAGKRPKRGPLWGGVQDDNKSWAPSGNDNATQAAFALPLRQNRILLIDTVVRRGGEATVGLMTVLDFGRGPREFGAGCDQRGSFEPTKIRLAAVFGDFICFENGHRSEYYSLVLYSGILLDTHLPEDKDIGGFHIQHRGDWNLRLDGREDLYVPVRLWKHQQTRKIRYTRS